MANPTTNYGFVLPTSSDLVTDLPADFDVALQGVDTRLKALQPGTTLGDLAYSSATANTNTRLGIGSTGQVLTVAGGVPTWSAAPTPPPSTTSYTLLNTGGTSLSGTTTTVSGLSGYNKFSIVVLTASASSAYQSFSFRFNSSATGYSNTRVYARNPNSYSNDLIQGGQSTTEIFFGNMAFNSASRVWGSMQIDGANSSGVKTYSYQSGSDFFDGSTDTWMVVGGGVWTNSSVISSISILSGASFDSGTIFIYGAN